jgi:non-homologous end joining protein Ku
MDLNAGGSLRSNLAELLVRKDQDLSRIRFQRVAESTGKEIPTEEIVKATRLKRINT